MHHPHERSGKESFLHGLPLVAQAHLEQLEQLAHQLAQHAQAQQAQQAQQARQAPADQESDPTDSQEDQARQLAHLALGIPLAQQWPQLDPVGNVLGHGIPEAQRVVPF